MPVEPVCLLQMTLISSFLRKIQKEAQQSEGAGQEHPPNVRYDIMKKLINMFEEKEKIYATDSLEPTQWRSRNKSDESKKK